MKFIQVVIDCVFLKMLKWSVWLLIYLKWESKKGKIIRKILKNICLIKLVDFLTLSTDYEFLSTSLAKVLLNILLLLCKKRDLIGSSSAVCCITLIKKQNKRNFSYLCRYQNSVYGFPYCTKMILKKEIWLLQLLWM